MRTLDLAAIVATLAVSTCVCLTAATSNTVGLIRINLAPAVTVAVADPFESIPPAPTPGGTVAALSPQAVQGDLLHLWTGQAFNTYTWSGTTWRVMGTLSPLPETRLGDPAGTGFLVTRPTSSPGEIVLIGGVPTATAKTLSVAARSWALLGYPYPAELRLAGLAAAGAGAGDRVRIWDAVAQAWRDYQYADGVWTGTAGESAAIPPGAAFLYFNARESGTVLTFQKP